MAEWLGLLSSSLARWVRQARIDRGQAGTRDQGLLTSEERTEFSRLRKEVQELSRGMDVILAGGSALCKRAAAAERFRLDRPAGCGSLGGLAMPESGGGPGRVLRLLTAAGGAKGAGGRECLDHR